MPDAASSFLAALASAIERDWRSIARPEQLPPVGDWSVWCYIAGRGAGKTRAGAEAIREWVETGQCGRVALIAPTQADARDVMVEGESGLLAIAPNGNRPIYEPSKRRLTWPSGAIATMYSAEEADRLRGPQHDAMWADELAAWKNGQTTWDMAMFGLRLGKRPRAIVTTTPKPVPLLRGLLKRDGQDVVVTRGRTADNVKNLAATFLTQIVNRYEGTRLGRQELDAEMLTDYPGAFWTLDMFEKARAKVTLPEFRRVVVGVDPSGARGADDDGADSIGIIVAARGVDGRGYLLADRTCKLSPAAWGRRAVDAYREFRADRIVAERNYGGAMVEHVIRMADPRASFKEVVASRGKVVRAEPIASLYEQQKISHIGDLSALEDQMCLFGSEGFIGEGSPDRVDAAVWALSELMLQPEIRSKIVDLDDFFRKGFR